MNKLFLFIRNADRHDFGGAERMPVLIANELTRLGYNTIILSRSKMLLKFADDYNVNYIRSWWLPIQNWSGLRILVIPLYILWQIVLLLYYIVLFRRLKPSAISIQSKDDFIAGTIASKILHIRVVWVDHGDLKFIWHNHNIWYKNPIGKLIYFISAYVDAVTTVSRNELKIISETIGGTEITKKINVIYNGINDSFTPSLKSINFISTARLVFDKGIEELIYAFKMLVEKFPNATLAIVGDGPDGEYFRELALDTPNIIFYGHQDKPLDILIKCEIFILPTYHEAFGVAVVEACMEGLAIIASNVGGIPEIVKNNKSGLLIPTKNIDALFSAMKKLYTNNNLRMSLGIAARIRFLDNFQLNNIVKNDIIPLLDYPK